ncbi:HEAT repeat domain-containing protein [Leptolyngbya sp. BC1307]|uniref:HEAT repeat domain-containing protein n=1 Tax=Leptolyngbya sp. BC1307 TaxID=2029589 RepID=UPI000EFC8626|nr:HEAT repeat domain-containing protein [Leptolyngbya sp. BC1307]
MSSAESISSSDSAAHPKDNPDGESIAEHETERQIEQAIAQLVEGDFQSKWDRTKRLDRQFVQWGDRPIPYLIDRLEDSTDPENQWFLVRALAQFDHPVVVEALAELLVTTTAEDLQLETIKALTQLGSSAIASLTHLLDPHQPLARRILAARTLARIRRSVTISPLLSIAADADPQLRAIAVEALGSFHDSRVTPVLLAALDDVSPVCIEAIRTLGRRADLLTTTDLIGSLQRCLYHPDEAIARESAVALGRLGGEAAVIALGESLTQPQPVAVKVAIVRALGWMDTPAAVAYLTHAFDCAVPVVMPAVQQEIARSLGQTRSATLKLQAAQPLLGWLQADNLANPTVEVGDRSKETDLSTYPSALALKQAVISSLARLSARPALDSLIPMLSDPDSRIRMHVLSALKQIDPKAAQTKIQQYVEDENTPPLRRQQVTESLSAW